MRNRTKEEELLPGNATLVSNLLQPSNATLLLVCTNLTDRLFNWFWIYPKPKHNFSSRSLSCIGLVFCQYFFWRFCHHEPYVFSVYSVQLTVSAVISLSLPVFLYTFCRFCDISPCHRDTLCFLSAFKALNSISGLFFSLPVLLYSFSFLRHFAMSSWHIFFSVHLKY